jgi:hypothetical protein
MSTEHMKPNTVVGRWFRRTAAKEAAWVEDAAREDLAEKTWQGPAQRRGAEAGGAQRRGGRGGER